MNAWIPRGADAEDHLTLVDGIPSWMEESVKAWLGERLTYVSEVSHRRINNVALVREYDLARKSDPLAAEFAINGLNHLYDSLDEDEVLNLIDWLVHRLSFTHELPPLRAIENVLATGGSLWKVGTRNGIAGLERRVAEGVQVAAEAVMQSGSAGRILSEAWVAAFGRSPDTEEAYEKAIKAVEEAGARKVSPNNARATLGTMVRDLEAQSDWSLALTGKDASVPTEMARALWTGQESRHGGNGYRKPTAPEAEAAVLLAVPLVQWFASDAFKRR